MKMMKHHRFVLSLLLCLLAATLTASADSKKEEIRQLQAAIDSLNRIAEEGIVVPQELKDDCSALAYCKTAYSIPQETLRNDMARLEGTLQKWDWVISHRVAVPEKLLKKVKNYDPGRLEMLYALAEMALAQNVQRYQLLRPFCEEVMEQRSKAAERAMPSGKLMRLYCEYEVYNSTPRRVKSYHLFCNEQGKWVLHHKTNNSDVNGGVVPDSVAQTVSQLVEEGGIYSEPASYANPPRFPDCPRKLDGKGNWLFECEFEGGSIRISGSPEVGLSPACRKVLAFLAAQKP